MYVFCILYNGQINRCSCQACTGIVWQKLHGTPIIDATDSATGERRVNVTQPWPIHCIGTGIGASIGDTDTVPIPAVSADNRYLIPVSVPDTGIGLSLVTDTKVIHVHSLTSPYYKYPWHTVAFIIQQWLKWIVAFLPVSWLLYCSVVLIIETGTETVVFSETEPKAQF